MLEEERRLAILRLLSKRMYASVGEIAGTLGVSEATVRRDLAKMDGVGELTRLRGGAKTNKESESAFSSLPEPPFTLRAGEFSECKRRIAEFGVSLCEDGETIIIDGGSTTFSMAEFLKPKHLIILTNSFAIAEVLIKQSRNTVILPGGVVYPESMLLLDHFNADYYANFSADKVFMSVAGIDEQGLTNTDALLIETERSMINRGREVYILADSGKFTRRGNLRLCGFDKVTAVITDSAVDKRYRELLAEHNVRCYIV